MGSAGISADPGAFELFRCDSARITSAKVGGAVGTSLLGRRLLTYQGYFYVCLLVIRELGLEKKSCQRGS